MALYSFNINLKFEIYRVCQYLYNAFWSTAYPGNDRIIVQIIDFHYQFSALTFTGYRRSRSHSYYPLITCYNFNFFFSFFSGYELFRSALFCNVWQRKEREREREAERGVAVHAAKFITAHCLSAAATVKCRLRLRV